MDKRFSTHLKITGLLGAATALILAVLLFSTASALVSYPPGALLQPGDVTSSIILNGTILDVDVSSSTAIQIFKLGTNGQDTAIPFLNNGNLNATSSLLAWNPATSRLTVGNIAATSTTIFNSVTYTWPAADGSASQTLQTNGAGTLSWAAGAGWQQLGETFLAANQQYATTTFAARRDLRVVVDWGGATVADSPDMRINGSAALNYSYKCDADFGAFTLFNSQSGFNLNGNVSTTSAMFMDIRILNTASTTKKFYWKVISTGGATGATTGVGSEYDCAGSYNDATNAITSVQFFNGTGNMVAPTRITVYGKQD